MNSTDDIPYKVEPGNMPRIVKRDPDPLQTWAHRLTIFAIGLTIALCLAAIFAL